MTERLVAFYYPDFRVVRAVCPPARRPDIEYWAAVVTGPSKQYKLEHEFLPKAYPAIREKRPRPGLDFTTVQVGDVVRHRGAYSRGRSDEEFWLIEEIDDEHVSYRRLSNREVAGIYRGEMPQLEGAHAEEA